MKIVLPLVIWGVFRHYKEMQKLSIYITEPDVINSKLVTESLGDMPHTIILGSSDFLQGDCSTCDTVIIRSNTHIDASVRTKMPGLRRIVRVGTGLDSVDLDFCRRVGIAVYNAPGANAEAVADYVVTVVMMALRKVHLLERRDVETWNRFKFVGQDIATRTIGIVGFGNIGRQIYEKFRGLGCQSFVVYDPFVSSVPEHARLVSVLDELVQSSDVISLHVPLLPQTKYCIGSSNVRLLRPDAILINASRGGIVDEQAVLEAMKMKQFTYIADTVEDEPNVHSALIEQPNVIITPHIASLTKGAENAMVTKAIANLLADKQAVVKGA
jgi:(S)-sulfolactate dehydrogenase